jgi:hypothetical protein
MTMALGVTSASAQSLEDLNIQIHGYATQGFIYTTQNNILTTTSSSGSPSWTEAVINVGAQPIPKLRIAVQGRYFLLGNYGNAITLDWAAADYKANDKFGVRFGKVKTPAGLLNEVQDIDPSYLWALLPQSIYPISSRNSSLSHLGGVFYGTEKLGRKFGKLEYRGWGGERVLGSDDGYFLPFKEAGLGAPNGFSWVTYGGALHWLTPMSGLMVGISDIQNGKITSAVTAANGALAGATAVTWPSKPAYFARYDNGKYMVAGEFTTYAPKGAFLFPGARSPINIDQLETYGMASYKPTSKLTTGVYYSQVFDHGQPLGTTNRYQKDWAISGRYDFNEFIYAKAEQHFIDGTALSYDANLNPNLKPNTHMTILKIGVSF